jgi:hypothetical protein
VHPAVILILVFGAIIAFVIVVVAVSAAIERKRTEALRKTAEEFGFEFKPEPGVGFLGDLSEFHLFNQGHSRTFKNLMRGVANGLDVCIFDYRFVVGHGKHQKVWQQSVFAVRCEAMSLPLFSLRPENIWHKIGTWFGYQDIDFESHPRFSKQYLLRGPDEEAIRAAFTPKALDYFHERSGKSVEGRGDLIVYYRSRRLAPEQTRSFMEEGFEVLGVFRPPAPA